MKIPFPFHLCCWLLALALPLRGANAAAALKPWADRADPADVAKSHVEEIGTAAHRYTIVQGGTMDGQNSRSPMGCGIDREGAYLQAWESNRSVRMENIGDTDVLNPWCSNGRNSFRNLQEIVASAVTPGMTDAEKAFALWFQEINYRHHCPGDNKELGDPVKVFNVYGYNTCGNDSIALATLWRTAGLKVAPARALGHCISQAFHDGGWHFYDGDMHSVYLLRDNETVASEQEIVRDHDLIKRTHSKGILAPDTPANGQAMCAMYFYEGEVRGARGANAAATMNMVLRPGEALEWRWGHLEPAKYHAAPNAKPVYESTICNGLWEYRPDFRNPAWGRGAARVENIEVGADGLAATAGQKGLVIWTVRVPYVFVGGRLELDGPDAKFFISRDGREWQPVERSLDGFFPSTGPAQYEYQLKCELEGAARLRRLAISNDLQMAPMALPEMRVGPNHFAYSDQSPAGRKVRITHAWVERSASRPPPAPLSAVYPPAGGETDGTDIVFRWSPAVDPDGDAIRDYQFELSNRADMRWPLSMGFYKLISNTADGASDKGSRGRGIKAQYTLSEPGLLTPDRQYYWRVRAKDEKGVWGDWSQVWSFTARGPAYPVQVALEYEADRGTGVLRWQPNAAGRRPVKYRIYGSDEKGFTVADEPYRGRVGVTKEEMKAWDPFFPANFIAETTATDLVVLGPGAAGNKTYYRVVAVDDHGKRSGPSDYATAPRPVIYSTPVALAKAGQEYRYSVQATRSLGDFSARMKGGKEVNGYFDIEAPKFVLEHGPSWLKIDETTGLLSGTPDAAGKAEVVVAARIEREVRQLDEPTLTWGNEKLLSVSTKPVGTASQKFVIDVR